MSDEYIQDPGHGGDDPGAVSHGNIEKVYTLEAGLYVDKRLADHGISSNMTRSSDVNLDEGSRVAAVKRSGAKKCLSHHFNAGGGSGVEVIHSIFSNGALAKLIADEFKKAGYPVRPRATFSRKGSKGKDYYYMHRSTGAVETNIIEYDFVDGPQSEKIKDKKYREGMYECVVRAVCREEGVKYQPIAAQKPVVKDTTKKKLFRVQVGAFAEKTNADRLVKELEAKGYKPFVKED
ncbi:N-acetylmuramoyl-L-alanine amidase [Fictibacillus sp. 7GRE50]|uniref:N-acetylmuramoyl-L-alanine amidase n=1 Tax=Fictibacillus sp. 7GRE50 TaxID=2745878 RepID=UPI0018CFA69B|nr:N-acetylmuramoyl-L-alanine amidase [Fictibacillus sp. 7GRE50]